jgi:hypothetical protein
MVDNPLVTLKRLNELWGTWQPPEESPAIASRADDLHSLSNYTAHFAAITAGSRDKRSRDDD